MKEEYEKLKKNINVKGNYLCLKSILITVIAMIIVIYGLLDYVATDLGGNFKWLILPSSNFGMPEEMESVIGDYVFENGNCGWDGQFYYYISNDILGLKDTAIHVDLPSYRWQRIGLPFLSRVVSCILFRKNVTVEIYIFTYLIILAIATCCFALFLEKRKHCVFWVLPWILSVGVQITLRHALPDGAADAFMVLAIIFFLEEKYCAYAIAITFASLTREANISIAFMIFLFGFFGLIKKEKKFDLKFAAILASPGIIFVAWYLYVTFHFGEFPFKQAYNITAPFLAGFKEYYNIAIANDNSNEILGLRIYVITIISALVLELFRGKKNIIYWSLIPFTFLVGSFGSTVISAYSGYLKGISSLFIYIPLMVVDDYSVSKIENKTIYNIKIIDIEKVVAFIFSIILVVTGIHLTNIHGRGLIQAKYGQIIDSNNEAIALTNFDSKVSLNNNLGAYWVDMPLSNVFKPYDKYMILNVNVINQSGQIWHYQPNDTGANAVYISYQWFKSDNLESVYMDGSRTSLLSDMQDGEERDLNMFVSLPQESGEYVLRLSLIQEWVAWFWTQGTGYVDINYTVQ